MTDPAPQLQAVALAALRADGGVAEAFAAVTANGVRVYEVPPTNAQPPYIVLQSGNTVPLLASGMDLCETELTATVFTLSDPPDLEDCMTLGQAMLACLTAIDDVPDYWVSQVRPIRSTYSLDHDGRTARGAIAVQFSLDGK